MTKPYEGLARMVLVHDFCSRVPDLYMDMFQMTKGLEDHEIVQALTSMDRDKLEGKKGRLLRRPFTEEQ